MNYYNSETLLEQQAEIEKLTAERDAFAIRLEDAENQYSELHDKNSALAAQVEALRRALTDIRHSPDDHCAEIAADALDSTPAACLAQVRAEAGRAAYFSALFDHSKETTLAQNAEFADQYAERILKEKN